MKSCASLLLILGSATACLADEPKLPDLPIEQFTLENGLRVVLHRDTTVPRVSVVVGYHVGSKNESAGRTGFAHFFEHMMFRGTKFVPNYDIPLQETGAQSNAFTTEDATVYFETVPAEFLERALYLEAERLADLPLALDQAKFDTEREVVKNERRQSVENVPYGMVEEATLAALYPKGHPYSWSVIGSMADLNAAKLTDLRRFFAEFYYPGNAVLVVSGDFEIAKTKALINKYFSPLAAGPNVAKMPSQPVKVKASRVRLADQVSLPRVELIWPTVDDDHPDRPALDLLAKILSQGVTSRLHRALVRDSRLATSVGASHPTKEIAGQFSIAATASEGRKIEEIEAALETEIERFKANPPTADELKRALASEEMATYGSLTSAQSRAFSFAIGALLKNDPRNYQEELKRYFAVTTADLARVAKQYLTPDRIAIVVEPAKAGEAKTIPAQSGPLPSKADSSAIAVREPKPGVDWAKLPGPNEAPKFQAPQYERKTLSNGVELWYSRWNKLPIVSVSLSMRAGSADDPSNKVGLADLTATLLRNGTKHKDAVTFAQELETLGAAMSASSGVERTSVGLSVLTRNLTPALRLMSEMLTEPRFDPSDFDREKQIQLSEILQGSDDPTWIAGRAFSPLLFGTDHPQGRDGLGRISTVKAITLVDVKKFAAEHYGTTDARLIVVGDVELEPLVAALESTIGTWKSKNEVAVRDPEPAPLGKANIIYLIDKPGAVQSVISVGRRWLDRKDPSFYASAIGNHIFGGDFLSRLNQNIRERNGFSYGASSDFGYFRTGGTWEISTNVRTDATAPALKEILGELDGLEKAHPLTPEEVELARKAVIQSFPESFASPGGIAGAINSVATYELPADYLQTFIPTVERVPVGEVSSVMSRVAAANARTILIVGDRKAIEAPLKALNRGEVTVVTLEQLTEPH